MHLRMHTKCIQSAYKVHTSEHEHIRERKERIPLLLLLYIACSSIFYCPRLQAIIFLLLASSDMYGYYRAIQITHQASLPVPLGRGRSQFTANHLGRELYALYASKNRLCTLCEDTTPKKTAYNAYRNANRRVRRAERLKMYAVGDAYRLHTECIQVSTNT